MADFELLKELVSPNQSKIVLLVMDGLGGLPRDLNGPTELEFANTPNLDRLAVEGNLGLSQPAGAGVSPGSGSLPAWAKKRGSIPLGMSRNVTSTYWFQKAAVAADTAMCPSNKRMLCVHTGPAQVYQRLRGSR